MWLDQTVNLIKKHEGLILTMYDDTKGLKTIGYGHCLDRKGITSAAAEHILSDDVKDAAEDAVKVFPDFYTLSDNRKAVLVSIAFMAGKTGLTGFHEMLSALSQKDFIKASQEIVESALPENRAKELAALMAQG